jgi:hypothetical protein
MLQWKCSIRKCWENISWIIVVGIQTHYSSMFISHNTILPQIILFLSKIYLSFLIYLALNQNTSFLINLEPKKIMYLNVSTRDNAIWDIMLSSKNKEIQEFSHNSYDDVGVFWSSFSSGRSCLLIDHSYV